MPKKKKQKLDLNWQERPEWRRKVEAVAALKKRGFTEDAITHIAEVPAMEVTRIIEDETTAREIARENYQNQVPLMKDIIGMGLEALGRCLKEIVTDDGVRREVLARVSDMTAMKNIIQDLSMLVRLEEGKSTQNVAVSQRSYQETRIAIQELKRMDPVFEYPDLPEPIKIGQ